MGKKGEKGEEEKTIRTKIEVWWAKKEKWKAKKMILPLRFWEAFSNQVWEGFQNQWNNIQPRKIMKSVPKGLIKRRD